MPVRMTEQDYVENHGNELTMWAAVFTFVAVMLSIVIGTALGLFIAGQVKSIDMHGLVFGSVITLLLYVGAGACWFQVHHG